LTVTGDPEEGGYSASLSGNATISANFGNPISAPESFSLSLSGLAPTPTLGAFGFTDFTGNDDNTASAVVTSTPEPSTMAIAGLGALGMIGYGLRRRKGKGA
jgi:PEP-CTERM motif